MTRSIFMFLAAAAGVYSFLIFIRIILSWIGGAVYGKPVDILTRIVDPYLNWWRRTLRLQLGFVDLSPVAAITALTVIQSVCSNIAFYGRISVGIILSVTLYALWSVISFILGFCLVIIILRMIAYLTNRNIYGPFWKVIDSISRPMLYRINRIIFGKRITSYLKGIIVSSLVLAAIWIGGRYVVRFLANLLSGLPL
ncbi:MAG: YggT family protein [Treponema sp.]|nr:YggT family protein [Treponema sp.]